MNEELTNKLTDKLNAIKEEYSIKMISMQFYSAFLNKYNFVVEQEGEELITNFILKHVSFLVQQDEENNIFPDAEFQDYFLAYVSSYVYDYELINEEKIADLVMSRFNAYNLLYIKEGKSEEEGFNATFIKEYNPSTSLITDIGPSYSEISPKIYRDAIKYIKKNIDYFSLYTMLDYSEIKVAISKIFTLKNKRFISFFTNEIPQILMLYDKNQYKLSIPNLIMASIALFLEWQQEHVIVTK